MNRWLIAGLFIFGAHAAQAADIPAVLQWDGRVELSTPVSGIVQSVKARVGDRVRKGEVLLSLDTGLYQAKVNEGKAAVARASADAADAKKNYERVKELYDRTVISTSELDQATARYDRSKAVVAEAQARLQEAQKNLSDAVLRAPYDAVVVARSVEPGQAVAATLQPAPLLVVARAGEMLARVRLDDEQLSRLKMGQEMDVVAGGRTYAGKVKTIGLEPVHDKGEVTYPVDIVFPIQTLLRAGMPATVKLP